MDYKDSKDKRIDKGSNKSGRMVRSVLSAQTFGLWDACGSASLIKYGLKPVLGKRRKIQALSNTETLFNVIIMNGSNSEKCLVLDVKASREASNEGVIDNAI